MSDRPTFTGFFSYAHHDAKTTPKVITSLTTELEDRVNGQLLNARFQIWRDKDGLKTGDFWNEEIEARVRAADILIILFTPRWIESQFCRMEYLSFEEVEMERGIGAYVAPILGRAIGSQAKHFTEDQKVVYDKLTTRQYFNAADLSNLSRASYSKTINKIADDIVSMIERRRQLLARPAMREQRARSRPPREFDGAAQNYAVVDIISSADVVIDRSAASQVERGVYAQISFIPSLYVESRRGHRIEFGVQRAYLSIGNKGPGKLSQADELKRDLRGNARYVTLHRARDAVTVCMGPDSGRSVLAELALQPSQGENYLAKVAVASTDVDSSQVDADLMLSLSAEGLYLAGHKGHPLPTEVRNKIRAIMAVAATKDASVDKTGLIRRPLPVSERSR